MDKILDDMDLSHVPRILVLNKMDLLKDAEPEGVYIGTATERSKVPSSKLKDV